MSSRQWISDSLLLLAGTAFATVVMRWLLIGGEW